MTRKTRASTASDAILPMTDEYMQQIVRREKNYEFRRYRISASVSRIWFYVNAPRSCIAYICEVDPARTRGEGHDPLPEDGKGNHEFNTYDEDWHGYDFAYRVRSVRKLRNPLTLGMMKEKYGFKLAPRGLVYLQAQISVDIPWDEQELIWTDDSKPEDDAGIAVADSAARAFTKLARKRKRDDGDSVGATRPTKYSK